MNKIAQLIVIAGNETGTVLKVSREKVTIGRNPQNDIVLTDSTISRFHAEIIKRDDSYYIHDLESAHGSYVNDVRVEDELPINQDDIIRMGETEIVFKLDVPAGVSPAEEPISTQPPKAPPSDRLGESIAFTMSIDTKESKGLEGKHLEMVSKIADATMSVFDLEELLGKLMGMLFEVFKPDRGVIFMRDENSGELEPRITRPHTDEVKVSSTVINESVEKRMSLLIADTSAEQLLKGAQSIVAQSILSAICAPLVRKEKVLGVIYLDAQSRHITYKKEDLALLNIIAAEAAISIENAILVKEKVKAERLAAIGVAIAGISHYVKNIIAGIVGSEALIDEGLKTDNYDMIREIWPIQKRSTKRISTLVQEMLSYSKEREPDWEPGDINSLVREVYEDQLPRAQKADVALILELDEEIPTSEFDHKAVHDTILNIVGNAIEACSEHGSSRVTLRTFQPDNDTIAIEIMDNGPGIPKEIQSKIFEPFFSTKGSKGTGLGLAVARKSILEHGGRLDLESSAGEGTTFTIRLPRKTPK